MTAATIVLASLSLLGGALVGLLAWRDVHPAPPDAREPGESIAVLLAQRYRPAPADSARQRPDAFDWSGPGEPADPVAAAAPDPIVSFVSLLGRTSLDGYAREPETREQIRAELARLLADRA